MTSFSLKLPDEGLARKPLSSGASVTNIAARFAAVAATTASATRNGLTNFEPGRGLNGIVGSGDIH